MRTIVSICLTTGLLFFCFTQTANATTYRVDRFDDSATATTCSIFNGDDCSLRGAIIKANQTSAPDLISLPAGTYTITIAGTWEDGALTGDLDITENLEIQGDTGGVTIDGNSLDRVFHILASATVHIDDLTITGGHSPAASGGGIQNNGNLFLDDCTITGNSSDNWAGGIYSSGGGLYLDRTSVSSNSASSHAGGIFNQSGTNLNIEDSTIYSNTASNGAGGGIYNNGSSTIRRTSVWGNNTYYVSGTHSRGGGGIYNSGSLHLYNCSMMINWAHDDGGGAIYNSGTLDLAHVSISGNLSSPASSTVILNGAGADVTMVNSLFTGSCYNDGGSMTSTGFNLQQPSDSCVGSGPGDQVNVADAMTTIVDVAGGSYKSVALEAGSPAIDMAWATYCEDTDQRKAPRPVDGDNNGTATCDIGAYEFLAEVVFHDGFEDGDFQAWSSQTP